MHPWWQTGCFVLYTSYHTMNIKYYTLCIVYRDRDRYSKNYRYSWPFAVWGSIAWAAVFQSCQPRVRLSIISSKFLQFKDDSFVILALSIICYIVGFNLKTDSVSVALAIYIRSCSGGCVSVCVLVSVRVRVPVRVVFVSMSVPEVVSVFMSEVVSVFAYPRPWRCLWWCPWRCPWDCSGLDHVVLRHQMIQWCAGGTEYPRWWHRQFCWFF